MEGTKLERVKETRYLGVIIDEKLNWNSHVQHIKSKIVKGSYILSKLRHYVNLKTLKLVYFSLIYPHLNYCITSWGSTSGSTLKPLFRLQKKIVRIITFSSFTCHSPPLFANLNLLPLDQIYNLNLSVLIHKIYNKTSPSSHNLIPLENVHNYQTRLSTGGNFYQNFNRINLGQSTYSAKGVKCWRKVPNEIKSLPVFSFKLRLKKYMLEQQKIQIN